MKLSLSAAIAQGNTLTLQPDSHWTEGYFSPTYAKACVLGKAFLALTLVKKTYADRLKIGQAKGLPSEVAELVTHGLSVQFPQLHQSVRLFPALVKPARELGVPLKNPKDYESLFAWCTRANRTRNALEIAATLKAAGL